MLFVSEHISALPPCSAYPMVEVISQPLQSFSPVSHTNVLPLGKRVGQITTGGPMSALHYGTTISHDVLLLFHVSFASVRLSLLNRI